VKEYKLYLPDRLKNKKKEILEYLMSCHYEDEVFSAGACSIILNVDKYNFKRQIYPKYEKEDCEE